MPLVFVLTVASGFRTPVNTPPEIAFDREILGHRLDDPVGIGNIAQISSKLPGVISEAAAGVKKATGFCFAASRCRAEHLQR